MKAFAKFKNEIWCMGLAYVDKLAKGNNDVNYLLVRQELFERTLDAKGMKTKDSMETFWPLWPYPSFWPFKPV